MFLIHKEISTVSNTLIKNLVINETDKLHTTLQEFSNILYKYNQRLCFEPLLELFEFVISPSDKLINGAIYTPKKIRNYITIESLKQLNSNNYENIKIVDISCGCGGFLIDVSKILQRKTGKSYKEIFENNIFGADIQEYSVNRTKILLSLLAIEEDIEEINFNIKQENSLIPTWDKKSFDLILGNPPYVCSRNMDDTTKILMQNWSSCRTGHPDLYIPFFQIGYELLKSDGILGYITVNSFIHSVNGRAIRQYFHQNKLLLIIVDFGDEQIFKSRMTYTCLCFIKKSNAKDILYAQEKSAKLKELKELKFNKERFIDLDFFKGWNLKDNSYIKKIESQGKPFGEIYDTKSGIATLKNNVYIFKYIKEDNKYYYKTEKIPIEKDICKDIINSNKLAKYDDMNKLIEKIIFPYRHDENGKSIFIEKDEFQKKYPKAYIYLLTQKELLYSRDKGNGNYPDWYAFGRNQSLELKKEKLFFPQLVKQGFKTFYSEDENLYFYNGMCAYGSKKELLKLEKIMKSNEFWNYIRNKAKNYASGYYGLGRNYLKDFGII
jgi:methylase of polypeptide subunit release factors